MTGVVERIDLFGMDPPLIRWGRHTRPDVSDICNNFFGLELPDEGWRILFESTVVGEDVDPLTAAVVPSDVITRIWAAVVIHILLPIATATPGTWACP